MDSLLSKIITGIINPFIYLLFAVASLFFFWGVLEFIMGASNPDKRKIGGKHMLWGAIGFLIMLSVFGILAFIMNTLGI